MSVARKRKSAVDGGCLVKYRYQINIFGEWGGNGYLTYVDCKDVETDGTVLSFTDLGGDWHKVSAPWEIRKQKVRGK